MARTLTATTLTLSGNEQTDATRTTGTQGDALTPPAGVGLWPATTNYNQNGGAETSATSHYNAINCTPTQDATWHEFGTKSFKLSATANGSFMGHYQPIADTAAAPGDIWTASAYVKAGSGFTFAFILWEFRKADTTVLATSSTFVALSSSAQRLVITTTAAPALTATIEMALFSSDTVLAGAYFNADGLQLEKQPFATPYVHTDGSTATRAAARVQGPAAALSASQMWISKRFRPETLTGLAGARLLLWKQDASNLIELVYENLLYKLRRISGGVSEEAAVVAGAVAGTSQLITGLLTPTGPAIALGSGNLQGPVLWDNFTRADGAIGTAPSGQAWNALSPAIGGSSVTVAAISGNKLTAADSGQATTGSHNFIDLGAGKLPTRLSCKFSFAASGSSSGTVLLISEPGGENITHVTDLSTHILFSDTVCAPGYWVGTSLTVPFTYTYAAPLAHDGTVYTVAWSIVGNTLTIEMPDGTVQQFTDSHYGGNLGRYLDFELFWNSGAHIPSFEFCGAEMQTATPNTGGGHVPTITTTTFDDGSAGGTASFQDGETRWELVGQAAIGNSDVTALNAFGDTPPTLAQLLPAWNVTFDWAAVTSAALLALPEPLTATLTVTPRIAGTLSLSPVGSAAAPNPAGAYVPNALHRVVVSAVADRDGVVQDNTNAVAKVTITNAVTGATLLAAAGMTYDSAGQWHYDAPVTAFPAGATIVVTVQVYDQTGTTLRRTVFTTLRYLGPAILTYAGLSINRLTVSALADLGVVQDDTNTACQVTIVDGTLTTLVNAAGMTANGSGSWVYDLPSGDWQTGALLTITVNVLDLAGVTQRGALAGSGWPGIGV